MDQNVHGFCAMAVMPRRVSILTSLSFVFGCSLDLRQNAAGTTLANGQTKLRQAGVDLRNSA